MMYGKPKKKKYTKIVKAVNLMHKAYDEAQQISYETARAYINHKYLHNKCVDTIDMKSPTLMQDILDNLKKCEIDDNKVWVKLKQKIDEKR